MKRKKRECCEKTSWAYLFDGLGQLGALSLPPVDFLLDMPVRLGLEALEVAFDATGDTLGQLFLPLALPRKVV